LEGEDISIAEYGTSPQILEGGALTQVLEDWENVDYILDIFDLQFCGNSGDLTEEGKKAFHNL